MFEVKEQLDVGELAYDVKIVKLDLLQKENEHNQLGKQGVKQGGAKNEELIISFD